MFALLSLRRGAWENCLLILLFFEQMSTIFHHKTLTVMTTGIAGGSAKVSK